MSRSTDLNISISSIFSNSHFKKVLREPDYPLLEKKVQKYSDYFGRSFSTREETLEELYNYLLTHYRCEYVYKNLITKRILLGRHSLNTSSLINEFRIGSSLADLILFNGSATVYEIKTELDSSERLAQQLKDYQTAFTKIYLVIHHSDKEKYLNILDNSSIGVIALSKRLHLSRVKEAKTNTSKLNVLTMFKCLRKEEYSNIIQQYFGFTPDVPNMYYFSESLKLAQKIHPIEFYQLMSAELKKRKPKEKQLLSSDKVPGYLANICISLDPNMKEYDQLFEYLNKRIM